MEVIERRYEYYSSNGKVWTDWFVYKSLKGDYDADKVLSECRRIPECYKKLKGEYRLAVKDELVGSDVPVLKKVKSKRSKKKKDL